jgi:hypothetical protein
MAAIKPWYQVVTPREDLRENRPLDASEFAVHLDHIRERRNSVSPDYLDPARFFDRTYLTGSLLELASQVVRRLAGETVETSANFNMATQFGGGKTHSLTALYHLAKGGPDAATWKGVDQILQKARIAGVPKADVAVFVGTEFDLLDGRGGKGEPTRKTPWGEIAWQLGGKAGYEAIRKHDEAGEPPAGDALKAMLPKGPTLILMDELLNYVSRGRKSGASNAFYNFLFGLLSEATGRDNLVVCVSIPASELEMSADDQADHDRLKKTLDRTGKPIAMSAGDEAAEIIRRRLFEWSGLPADGRRVAQEYADWAINHAGELTDVDATTIKERFERAYPFHPAVLSVFERKWQSLPRFQRTRGILRLLALWVANSFQEEHRKASKDPLIMLGTAPLHDQFFRTAMFEQLGENKLEVPVVTDIDGRPESHAKRLDREAGEPIKATALHRKVATAVLFESNGGMSATKTDATLPEIRMAIGTPSTNLADVEHVLDGLSSSCFYLTSDQNRYRFSLQPNLNQILVTRRGAVKDPEIDARIAEETQKLFAAGPKEFDRKMFPTRSNDVPSRPALTLVALGLDHPVGDAETTKFMDAITRECGTVGRTFKSALIFSVPSVAENIRDTVRSALAWEAIDDDKETTGRLDDAQKRTLAKNLQRAKSDIRESLWRSYRNLYLLGADNKLRHVDLGQITSSMADSLPELILNQLTQTDEVVKSVGPSKLVRYWPGAIVEWSTKAARDAFYASPQLPRLLTADVIKRTIADGVSRGDLGYATKNADGALKLVRFKEALTEAEVEIDDEHFILQAAETQKLLEPPRLATIAIEPGYTTLGPGGTAAFKVTAKDQYGQPFIAPAVTWTAKGGEIAPDGTFTAGTAEGSHGVSATAGDITAAAEVRVQKAGTGATGGTGGGGTGVAAGKQRITWSGEVPSQKWTKFYSQVLAKFAVGSDLKIRVTFEATIDAAQAKAKLDEARVQLRELGLAEDNVEMV